ncbi:MAG: DNA-3-methyladenine glycosylase 2 family protein, partial [Acidobacteria bacterium]|nr:DNA-3-methyladenine glycosylase 2 family protein [Acidobacteriota bacterium]
VVRSIMFQQLNGTAARTIYDRLLKAAGGKITPESLNGLSDEQLRAVGLSRQKTAYLRDLIARTLSGEIEFERLPEMSDDDVIEHLTRVKGIGVWTAHMFLIFALRRPNIMPTLDYGIQAAVRKWYRKRKMPKHDQLMKLAKKWDPYCSIASWYLWRSTDLAAAPPPLGDAKPAKKRVAKRP